MFGGRGMGGGRGGMLRTVGKTVTRVGVAGTGSGPQEPFSVSSSTSLSNASSKSLTHKPKSSNPLSLSSSVSSHASSPISGIPLWHRSPETDDYDWVSVDEIEDEVTHGCLLDPVPPENEVDDTLCALKQVFGPASHAQLVRDKYYYNLDNELDHVSIPGFLNQDSSDGSEIDWAEPSLIPYDSKMLLVNGSERVHYAFHLLQTEPSVQSVNKGLESFEKLPRSPVAKALDAGLIPVTRMVKSLSSDNAVWNAVLNNEVVRELRESISSDEEHVVQRTDGTSNKDPLTTTNVVMWIFDTAKAKFMEVIGSITKIVNELFQPADHKTAANAEGFDPFNEKLRTSLMLTIMVLLVVVVSRAHAQGMP